MRTQPSKLALKAIFAVAIVLTLSCSSNRDDKEQSYDYCITSNNRCLTGPFTISTCNGQLSNNCPYGSSSSVASIVPSSSSAVPIAPSSSSIAPPISSSVVPSSSSSSSSSSVILPSSSAIVPSSSSSVPLSSSSVVLSSSSAILLSSSSAVPSSSSSVPLQYGVIPGPSVYYEDEIYQTVVIGTQTWFKRNLNYAVAGNKCYDDLESNCTTYGRLYNWATAMGLDQSYNATSFIAPAKHRGICPLGWHIPSDAEWDVLVNYAGGTSKAGTKLKSADGWAEDLGFLPSTDNYGFAALPGGRYSGSLFSDVSNYGYWWSATEYGASNAYYRVMNYSYEDVFKTNSSKNYLQSVRCLQD